MKRGGVWWINFQPATGGEIKKTRPAVIISTDYSNKFSNRVVVVPFTSSTENLYPSEAIVTINNVQSKAMADQISTVDKLRLIKRICNLSKEDIKAIESAVKIHLEL